MAVLTGLFTLGRDAETRVTQGGTTVVQLAAAYNYGRKGDDGRKPTQWLRLSMFGRQAEALAPHLTKGKQVSLIVRDLHISTFPKNDGTEGYALEGVADFDDFARGGDRQSAPAQVPAPVQRQAPRPASAPRKQFEHDGMNSPTEGSRAPMPRQGGSSGFDDMDDDIPFSDPMKLRGYHAVI